MMAPSWDEIEALFEEALTHEADERSIWLRAACDGRPALYAEVAAMLDAHHQPLGIEPRLLADDAPSSLAGARVGPFRLLDVLGHGGMGSVWLAEYADGVLDRRVAVKLARLPHTPDEARLLLRRFEAERRILARLQHPGIVRLLEAGTEGGYPYFAMDYVPGRPLTDYAGAERLPVEARLRLFVQVCDAVHHAHQRLVVHRDLKPSNVLVASSPDGTEAVKLLDFGIARLLDDDGLRTETGLRPMTRAYAAPEQLRGEPATTATDVYALGVVLYELLTGRRPFDAPTPAALERAILTAEPSRPSAALAARSPAPDGPGPHRLAPHRLRGDLDAIALKALRKEPEDRYASAEAFAADVQRHLDGLPVLARVPSAGYRLRAFVRRHRAGVAMAAAVVVLLTAFIVVLALQQRATARERDTAQATAAFLEELFGAADPYAEVRQDTLRIRDLLARGVEQARLDLAEEPLVRARLLHGIGRAYVRLGAHGDAEGPLSEAIALLRTGGDRALLAGGLTELASVHNARGRHEDAEALARDALALARALADPPRTDHAEQVLAQVLLNTDRSGEAIALLRASLERQRAAAPDTTTAMLGTERMLGMALLNEGRFHEAEPRFLAVRDAHVRRFGSDDARLVGVLSPLAFLYLATGRLEASEITGARAVALLRAAQPGSARLSQTLASYASVLRRRGKLGEAEAALREALALPQARAGNHAIVLGTLASVLHDRGDLTGAIDAQRQAVAFLREDVNADVAPVLYSRIKLAGFLREARRFDEAEAVLLAARNEQRRTGLGVHTGNVPLASVLAGLYDAWGRPDEAARWRGTLGE